MLFIVNLILAAEYSNSKLPILSLKNDVFKMRFVSSNGDLTYFQSQEGELFLNYKLKITSVMKGKPETFYQVNQYDDIVLITKDETYFSNFNLRKNNEIFVSRPNDINFSKIGDGQNPQLHLKNTWISYQNENNLIFKKISAVNSFNVTLFNSVNPYFISNVIMLSETDILFTDINKEHKMGLLHFNTVNKETTTIYRATEITENLELCANESIYLGIFNSGTLVNGSKIIPIVKEKTTPPIYTSDLNDLGHLICDKENIYFIKNLTGFDLKDEEIISDFYLTKSIDKKNKSQKLIFEIAKLDLKDNSVKIVSDLEYTTQVISIGDRILVPFLGRYHIVKGSNDLNIDNLQPTPKT